MADNKKITPLNVPKVKRGVKGALTPGEPVTEEVLNKFGFHLIFLLLYCKHLSKKYQLCLYRQYQ